MGLISLLNAYVLCWWPGDAFLLLLHSFLSTFSVFFLCQQLCLPIQKRAVLSSLVNFYFIFCLFHIFRSIRRTLRTVWTMNNLNRTIFARRNEVSRMCVYVCMYCEWRLNGWTLKISPTWAEASSATRNRKMKSSWIRTNGKKRVVRNTECRSVRPEWVSRFYFSLFYSLHVWAVCATVTGVMYECLCLCEHFILERNSFINSLFFYFIVCSQIAAMAGES